MNENEDKNNDNNETIQPSSNMEGSDEQRADPSCSQNIRSRSSSSVDSPLSCAICFEAVPSDRKFGLLENCDHVFCHPCIREWRRSRQSNRLLCPQCRTLSNVMIPSQQWFSSTEEKSNIFSEKLAEMARKPCRFFRGGSGVCNYGQDCRFLHEVDPNLPQVSQERDYDVWEFPRVLSYSDYDDELDVSWFPDTGGVIVTDIPADVVWAEYNSNSDEDDGNLDDEFGYLSDISNPEIHHNDFDSCWSRHVNDLCLSTTANGDNSSASVVNSETNDNSFDLDDINILSIDDRNRLRHPAMYASSELLSDNWDDQIDESEESQHSTQYPDVIDLGNVDNNDLIGLPSTCSDLSETDHSSDYSDRSIDQLESDIQDDRNGYSYSSHSESGSSDTNQFRNNISSSNSHSEISSYTSNNQGDSFANHTKRSKRRFQESVTRSTVDTLNCDSEDLDSDFQSSDISNDNYGTCRGTPQRRRRQRQSDYDIRLFHRRPSRNSPVLDEHNNSDSQDSEEDEELATPRRHHHFPPLPSLDDDDDSHHDSSGGTCYDDDDDVVVEENEDDDDNVYMQYVLNSRNDDDDDVDNYDDDDVDDVDEDDADDDDDDDDQDGNDYDENDEGDDNCGDLYYDDNGVMDQFDGNNGRNDSTENNQNYEENGYGREGRYFSERSHSTSSSSCCVSPNIVVVDDEDLVCPDDDPEGDYLSDNDDDMLFYMNERTCSEDSRGYSSNSSYVSSNMSSLAGDDGSALLTGSGCGDDDYSSIDETSHDDDDDSMLMSDDSDDQSDDLTYSGDSNTSSSENSDDDEDDGNYRHNDHRTRNDDHHRLTNLVLRLNIIECPVVGHNSNSNSNNNDDPEFGFSDGGMSRRGGRR